MKAPRNEIPVEHLYELILPDFETGKLFWLPRDPKWFALGGKRFGATANAWNARFAGKEAFTALHTSKDGKSYYVGAIHNKLYRAHRVIWAMGNGRWPDLDVDHWDGDSLNNRLENLRDVTNQENHFNASKSKSNTSGVNGVTWDKQTGRWRAGIKVNYRHICLGRYAAFEDAVAARRAADRLYGFTERHGT